MLCPNCDSIINATGCQACGWKTGDQFPAHRLSAGSVHPLREGLSVYPERIGGPRAIQVVSDDPGVRTGRAMRVAPGFNAPVSLNAETMFVPELDQADPASAEIKEQPIPDPKTKTVQ